jgi:hypothetical protein
LKNERQFNQEQYDRLLKCSQKGPDGIEEWNKWREEKQNELIWLQGAKLRKANLQGADLTNVNLQDADLRAANLQKAFLWDANLQEAILRYTKLQGVVLENTNLQGAKLQRAKLQGAELMDAKLQGAELVFANLQEAILQTANLEGADFREAYLEGANLREAKLQGAIFLGAAVNGSTNFLDCEIDENTDLRNTGLENTRIESGTKIRLKYNIRRMNWEDWYAKHRLLKWPVKLFWSISNYGINTKRIIAWFFGLATAFALVYYFVPGLIKDLHGTGVWYSDLVRACYFSVVTMTTLGFGDMYANKQSVTGHLLLIFQVILGYVLLGALVTRLAVLFTSDGPVGSYTPMDKKTKELLKKLKEEKERK